MADPMDYLRGFAVTFKKLFEDRVTTDYRGGRAKEGQPDEKRAKTERLHGRHVLNRYEDGMEKCIGCELCAGVCPANCIYVRGADNDPDEPTSPGERFGFVYEINYLRCIHCDFLWSRFVVAIIRRTSATWWKSAFRLAAVLRVTWSCACRCLFAMGRHPLFSKRWYQRDVSTWCVTSRTDCARTSFWQPSLWRRSM